MKLTPAPVSKEFRASARRHVAALRRTVNLSAVNASRMGGATRHTSTGDPRPLIESLSTRVKHLLAGSTRDTVSAFLAEARENLDRDDYAASRADLLESVRLGDKEAVALHAEIVTTTTTNLMLASSNWAPFFDVRNLGDSDQAWIENRTPQEMKVEVVGIDGGNEVVQSVLQRYRYPVPLFMLWSDDYEYPLVDVNLGSDVRNTALTNIDMARDTAYQIDSLMAGYLTAGATNSRLTATFNVTGDEAERDYVVHSRVNTANFPAGNFITLSSNTGTSTLRKEVLDTIIEYALAWGTGALPEGDLIPVAIHIASKDANGFLGSLTAASSPNKFVEAMFEGGAVLRYGPYTFALVADNTIDPDAGVAYVRFNRPVGVMFTKSSLDQTLVDTSYEARKANKERTAQGKVLGFGLPNPWKVNVLGVKYRT